MKRPQRPLATLAWAAVWVLVWLVACAPPVADAQGRSPAGGAAGGGVRPGGMPGPGSLPGGVPGTGTAWPGSRPPATTEERSTRDSASTREGASREAARESEREGPRQGPPDAAAAVAAARGERTERIDRADRLLRANPSRFEPDPAGAPVLRAEITVLLAPQAGLPPALLARGFTALRESQVFGRRLVVLGAPAGLPLAQAVELTQRLAPDAEVDFNHLLLGSGQVLAQAPMPPAAAPNPATPRSTPAEAMPVRVGLIDEALRPGAELRGVQVQSRPCAASAAPPGGHGNAVASVLARALQQAGRQPVLHAADMACGHGAVDAIANALQAMDQDGVPVVNLSAVGPHNRVLAAVVAAFLARGHLLVAPVGNDGPAAPPLYPAAYPGVVAVTGVDAAGRVLTEAGRGEHVAFAALGVVDIDSGDGTPRRWRGTSFAAPVVAAALALRLPAADPRAAAAAVADLARNALDLGEPGRDRVHGFGLVGPPAAQLAGTR